MMGDDDSSDRLQVLLAQECTSYMTRDYLITRETVEAIDDDSSYEPSTSSRPGTKKRKFLPVTPQISGRECNSQMKNTSKKYKGDTLGVQASDDQVHELRRMKHWREKMCEWAYQGKQKVTDEQNGTPMNLKV
jgi:hypothetical protein